MYDLNLSVPNLTSENYSVENKFAALKNYLYELNEMLAVELSDKTAQTVNAVEKLRKTTEKAQQNQVIALKSQSLKKFNQLKEDIIRTAQSIETSYKSDISKSEKSILAEVEKSCVSKSDFGDYKTEVNTAFEQTAEEISLVSNNTDEVSAELQNYKLSARSELEIKGDAIISKVEEKYQTKEDASSLESRISSEIIQLQNSVTETFSENLSALNEDISSVGGSVNELISELDVYIRRGELSEGVYGIEIGRSDSNIKARFTNDRLSFYQGTNEVAYISGSSLYITNADVLDYLRIGNKTEGYFLFDTTQNGLEVRWINAE